MEELHESFGEGRSEAENGIIVTEETRVRRKRSRIPSRIKQAKKSQKAGWQKNASRLRNCRNSQRSAGSNRKIILFTRRNASIWKTQEELESVMDEKLSIEPEEAEELLRSIWKGAREAT
ncbi:hypothetical protein FQR65_LT13387 [Abscondita terminalis]|nr:hypothetical protein FQR65_LT13387 [Abscondita terminalis]